MDKHSVIYASVHDIERWKAELLEHVVDAFASQKQADIQKSISAWRWSDSLPFPRTDDISVNGGCLTFEVLVAEKPVFFSLWFTFGEIRVGIRVPQSLLGVQQSLTDQAVGIIAKKLSTAYDGAPCQKITASSNGQFFDWIFRDVGDGFASFATGHKATQDKKVALTIASRLADVLIHLYMATMNILIEDGKLKVTLKQISTPASVKYFMIEVRGDTEAFEYWIKKYGTIDKKFPWGDGRIHYRIAGDRKMSGIPVGDTCIDGAWFSILEVKEDTVKENQLALSGTAVK